MFKSIQRTLRQPSIISLCAKLQPSHRTLGIRQIGSISHHLSLHHGHGRHGHETRELWGPEIGGETETRNDCRTFTFRDVVGSS